MRPVSYTHLLNEEQQNVVSKITMEYDAGERKTYLIKGCLLYTSRCV